MRKRIVAGNWKMNKNRAEGIELIKEINYKMIDIKKVMNPGRDIVIIAPPYPLLLDAVHLLGKDYSSGVSAQNCASEADGAYTGEVAVNMIKSVGAEFVIIGHSERRNIFGESDEIIGRKTKLALEAGLQPIFCFGENLEERNENRHFNIVKEQLSSALIDLSVGDFQKIILAYEPVWAIGTGINATPEQAGEMHTYIRQILSQEYGNTVAHQTTILYGGSCKPSNAESIFSHPNVDGGLIGGASLNADDFIAIIKANLS